jgi:hypothetical protein
METDPLQRVSRVFKAFKGLYLLDYSLQPRAEYDVAETATPLHKTKTKSALQGVSDQIATPPTKEDP